MVKRCTKCSKPLIVNGVHMGIPFALWHTNTAGVSPMQPMLVCTKCYDLITVEELKKDV